MACDVKVIGIGSPFGADQVGWQVVDQLREELGSNVVQLEKLDRPGASLLEEIKGSSAVILVDAMCSALEVGAVRRLTLDDVVENDVLLSSHGFGVQQSLSLGNALGGLPSRLVIYGIEVDARLKQDSDHKTEAGIAQAVALIKAELLRYHNHNN